MNPKSDGTHPIKILLLEDNPGDAGLLQAELATYAPGEFALTRVECQADALKQIKDEQFDVVLSDLDLPDSTGLATMRAILAAAPKLPLVVLTGLQDDELGRTAIRQGAQDFLVKGEANGALIARTLRYAIERARLENQLHEVNATLERRVAERTAELVSASDSLRENEAQLRLTTEMANIAIWEYDFKADQMLRSANHDQLYGLVRQERWNIDTFLKATHPDDRHRGDEIIRKAVAPGGADDYAFDFRVVWPAGQLHWLWVRGQVIKRDSSGQGLVVRGVLIDVTERKTAEAKIQRLTQLYAALSQSNGAIVRCTSEEELFPQVCRAAVQFGGMKMAWVGMVEPDSQRVRFVASAGDRVQEYLLGVEISVAADSPFGLGPTGVAFREDHPVWCQDFRNDPLTAPWHERSVHFGWGASASLPLRCHGLPVGVLTLLASEVGAFDEATRNLLIEMATDISFALDNFARETARERAEKQAQGYLTQLESAFMSTVEVATTLSELRDPYTAGHERRVGKIAAAIGAELGLDAHQQEGLRVAGYLHDIGKITIPAEILSKPGKLSRLEFQLIQAHAQSSYEVLKDVRFPWPVAEVALQHHERMDGSGYPQGLRGNAILLEARIMAVADVVEAMSSHRPYRAGLGIDAALVEIERGSGCGYDRVVAAACLRLFREKGYTLPD